MEPDLREKMLKDLEDNGYPQARIICGSKSLYRIKNPHGRPIFNANLISKKLNCKFWHGDIDLSLDSAKLRKLARKHDDSWCVLFEMDGKNEKIDYKAAEDKAAYIID